MLLKQGKKDNLEYFVFETRKEMGTAAALSIAEAILEELEAKETINMIFAAAPSQNETLASLVANHKIPWNRINAFHMDEYIGLSENAPQRFGQFLKHAIFDKVNFRTVNYIDSSAENVFEECERYSKLLLENPVDIVCLGIGENGHIAFNDPDAADFEDDRLVKVAKLDEICRQQQVNDGCFESLDDVPTHALTLTIPALCRGSKMFCTVPSATKRCAVNRTLNGTVNEECPATVMRKHGFAKLYLDAESGADLI